MIHLLFSRVFHQTDETIVVKGLIDRLECDH